MRLTDLLSGLLAKAAQPMPSLFGGPATPTPRKSLDQRKDHLHQETRVDKRGIKSTRWVRNAEHQPAHAATPAPMPDLFAPPAPMTSLFDLAQQQVRQQTRRPAEGHAPKPRVPKPAPAADAMPDLFSAPAKHAGPTLEDGTELHPLSGGRFQLGYTDTRCVHLLPVGGDLYVSRRFEYGQYVPEIPYAYTLKDNVMTNQVRVKLDDAGQITQLRATLSEMRRLQPGAARTIAGHPFTLGEDKNWHPAPAENTLFDAPAPEAAPAPLQIRNPVNGELHAVEEREDGSVNVTGRGFELRPTGTPDEYERVSRGERTVYRRKGQVLTFVSHTRIDPLPPLVAPQLPEAEAALPEPAPTPTLTQLAQQQITPPPPAPTAHPYAEPQTIQGAAGISATIAYNAAHSGLEVRFSRKPDDSSTTGVLKDHGFRWSGRQGVWYAKDGPRAQRGAEALRDHMKPVDFKAMAEEVRQQQGHAPTPPAAPVTPPETVTPAASADGSLGVTQDEHAAWNAGVLHTGSIKTENGVTYRLNDNHRWERVKDLGDGRVQGEGGIIYRPKGQSAPDPAPADLPTRLTTRTGKVYDALIPKDGGVTLMAGAGAVKPVPGSDLWASAEGPERMWFRRDGTELHYVATGPEQPAAVSEAPAESAPEQPAPAAESGPPAAPAPDPTADAQAAFQKLIEADFTLSNTIAQTGRDYSTSRIEVFMQANLHRLSPEQQAAVRAAGIYAFKAAAAKEIYEALRPRDDAPAVRRKVDYSKGFAAALPTVPSYAFDLLPRSTKATRRAANDAALTLARSLEAEGRLPTEGEREVLSRWSGQGGVTGDINAYYTPTKVAAAMWGLLHTHGFTGGRVLEPSIGGGVFAETAPASVQMTGVEYNGDTVSVVRALHPDAQITHAPMETYNTSSDDALFDAVIGNPPYGSRGNVGGGTTRDLDKPDFAEAEQYFIDTALDRVKPGGLVAVLVNSGVMQNLSSRAFRARMLARAEVVTVVRAPLSTFEDSGAAVTPDVILLRKRPDGVGEALASLVDRHGEDALDVAGVHREDVMSGHYIAVQKTDDNGVVIGYADGHHPDHALGDIGGNLRARHGGYQTAVRGTLDADSLTKLAQMPADDAGPQPQTLDELAATLREHGVDEADIGSAVTAGQQDHYPIPDGALSPDGELVFRNHRWHQVGDNDLPHVRQFISLARDVQEFHRLSAQGSTFGAEALRQSVLEQVQAYHAAHGDPHSNPDVQKAAGRLPFLRLALAAIQGGQAIGALAQAPRPLMLPDDADPRDADSVAHALAGQGRLTPDSLADAAHEDLHLTALEAKSLLCDSPAFAYNGTRWQTAEDYYWGDAYAQADAAESLASNERDPALAAKLRAQAAQFRSLVTPKSIDEIDFSPRDKWVPLDAVEAWVNEYLDSYERKYSYNPATKGHNTTKLPLIQLRYENGAYRAVPVKDKAWENTQAWRGLKNASVQQVVDYLNRRTSVAKIGDKEDLSQAEYDKRRADNVRQARDFETGLRDSFRTFVYSGDFAPAVEHEYNRSVNSYLAPADQNEPFHLEGWDLKAFTPHPFQYASVKKAVAQGSSYIALDVGLGKTGVGLMLATKLKQEGRAKKPTVVMPASMLTEWANEAERILPGKKVLVLGVSKGKGGKWQPDSAAQKKDKLARLAAEDWDLVVMNHELFEAIPMRRETREQLIMSDFERQRLESLKGQRTKFKKDGDLSSDALKNMSGFVSSNISKVKVADETSICFEDLGIDALIADEAHEYKNLFAAPTEFGESVKFLGGGAESNQAMEFQHKTKFIRQQNGDGSGIFCMSATPTKNSPLEIYYALQFITDDLAKRGIPSTEDFMDRYCVKEQVIVPGKDGNLKSFQGVVGFKNLDELRSIMDRYLIRETAQTALMKDRATGELIRGLKLPERQDIQQFFDMSEEATEIFHGLKAEALAAKSDEGGAQHLFSVYSRMRKLTLDPALHSASLAAQPNPRFVKAAEITAESLRNGGKVVMFMDNGEGMVEGGDDEDGTSGTSYDRLVDHLVEHGIPREQIKVVTGKTASKAQRAQIAQDFRDGKYRVVIGNKVMEQGMNLQKGTTDMIHLTTPWDPGSYWQRLGRAIRQGNDTETVKNHVLLARGSFDQFTYSALMGKKGWTDTLWDPTTHGGANGDAMSALDNLQVQFAENKEAEQARLTAERGKIEAAQHAQMVKSTSALLETFMQTRTARAQRDDVAQARPKGPTASDKQALARLDATMNKLRTTIEATGDYPFKPMLEHAGEVFITSHGIPMHKGLSFMLPLKGQLVRVTVQGIKSENKSVFVKSEDGALSTWLKPDTLENVQGYAVAPQLAQAYADRTLSKAAQPGDTLTALYRRMLA